MSMAHSLELRVPYLDREVLREAQTYPDSYKLRGDTKAVLRTAANKTLPDAWANRTKKGFPVPIAKWLEDPAFSAKVRKSFTSDVAAEYSTRTSSSPCWPTPSTSAARSGLPTPS